MCRHTIAAFLLLPALAAPAAAHDYWLQPATFFPRPGDKVAVRLLVGDRLEVEDERPFLKKPTLRFQLVSKKQTLDLAASTPEGGKPLAQVICATAGAHWIVMDRDVAYITLPAKNFNSYLKEEGLAHIVAERKKAKEDDKDGRERYRRYLKCLLQAGDAADDAWQKTFAQKLEIVPLANPVTLKVGDVLRVKVLFDDAPLANAPLFAHCEEKETLITQRLHTDKDGVAAVRLHLAAPYLVRLVHMRRCAGDARADWESFWSALTFAVK